MVTTQIIKSNDIDSLRIRLNDFLKTINNEFIDIKLTQQDNWYTVLVLYRNWRYGKEEDDFRRYLDEIEEKAQKYDGLC